MTYLSAVLADNPLVLLALDETSGLVAANQGTHAPDGSYEGGVLLNQTGMSAGVTVSAQFDGVNDYINVPDHADLDILGDLTLEALIYPTSFAAFRMLITKALADVCPYQWMLMQTTGLPTFRHGNGFAGESAGTRAPRLNAWNLVGVRRSGTTFTHFLDGSPNGSGTIPGTPIANAEPLRFGRRSDNNFWYIGKAAMLAVYPSALSDARMYAHAAELPAILRASQVGIEVVAEGTPKIRASQLAVEAAVMLRPFSRVSQMGIEVVYTEGAAPVAGERTQIVTIG